MTEGVDARAIEALFTRKDGQYLCARWGRPIVPVVFGLEDHSLSVFKGAVEAIVTLAGHKMSDVDPELGANLMVFFCRDWDDLMQVPNLERLVPDLGPLVARLTQADANQYRIFRFDEARAIRACFVFIKVDAEIEAVPVETLALAQAVQLILLWSDTAFVGSSPLGLVNDMAVLKPQIAGVIRAAYDPVLPAVATDPAHALRLAARISTPN